MTSLANTGSMHVLYHVSCWVCNGRRSPSHLGISGPLRIIAFQNKHKYNIQNVAVGVEIQNSILNKR